jgi:hypothetical protein
MEGVSVGVGRGVSVGGAGVSVGVDVGRGAVKVGRGRVAEAGSIVCVEVEATCVVAVLQLARIIKPKRAPMIDNLSVKRFTFISCSFRKGALVSYLSICFRAETFIICHKFCVSRPNKLRSGRSLLGT